MRALRAAGRALVLVALLPWAAPTWADDPPPAPPPAPEPFVPSLPGQPVDEPPAPPQPPVPVAPDAPLPAPVPAPAPPPVAPPLCPPQDAPSLPDVVRLENGSVFEGTLIEETPEHVVLEIVGTTGGLSRVTIARARISTILRGDGRTGPSPGAVTLREAWYLLRSGGEIVGTRHELLRSLRVDGRPGFRLEETVVQLPQGKRIPRTRFERVEDTDLSFLPRRMQVREAVDPLGAVDQPTRFDRAISGSIEKDVWTGIWRRGSDTGRSEVALPAETRGVLGLRELLLRGEREPGLARQIVLDAAEGQLVEVEAGFAAVAKATGGTDEFHWVVGGQRRVTRYRGQDVVEDRVSEGVSAILTTEAQARAVEEAARSGAVDPKRREVTLPEPGLKLVLPGPDWSAAAPVASGMDSGRRVVARLASQVLLAEVRVEWDPEGMGPGVTEAGVEAALLERLRAVCFDLAVVERRRPAEGLPGAWRLAVFGTLRDTPVRTLVLVVPRGAGLVYLLAAVPDASWAAGRQALEDLLASVRPL